MNVLNTDQQVPTYTLEQDPVIGGRLFTMARFEGALTHQSELLVPHRKDYYLLVFTRQGNSRHWVDMTPYVTRPHTMYVFVPNQLTVKEEPKPMWATAVAFTKEFLALQENAALSKLPLIQNPRNAHELLLTDADVAFIEDMLEKIHAEYRSPGEWQQRMLTAWLTVLLTYLSRLYTEQFESSEVSTDKILLKEFHGKIGENFRELHQVSEYAGLLHVSAGYLSEVVKAQSGRPAIAHIHERLVLESRRLLFHTRHSSKEIAFELGFSDASYFNRFFKRETNLTPAEYRAATREMYQ
ncbi:helix-turn-helix transcriptional regulator [Dyadobacter sandarakinus]|uniref:Helix-turn-helix domain-containing protein n=1 Tax=Dyadobacter sandarakinus TaxID=2747268 RepID=A0ABX7I2I3_9BACT|nr:helix-turn-helix transcriptional regulator [Dyadobacter sandarakinus]QRR00264.1 helix-turn-helix domain-containing protein [Dyadobacter sandarakinus]